MKKLLMVALVIGLVFSLAQVTVAEDRLQLSGEARIRAFHFDNEVNPVEDVDDVQQYFDSRFRLGMTIAVAEGITANVRADIHDDQEWGTVGLFGRPAATNNFNVDRMFIRIEKDMFIFQGGQIFQAFGAPRLASAYAPQDMGLALRLKLPVMIDLNYFKLDEGTSYSAPPTRGKGIDDDFNDDGFNDEEDLDMYAIQAQYKADMFAIGAYYATQIDSRDEDSTGAEVDYNPSVVGLWGNTKIGPVGIDVVLDMFSGAATPDVDYMGTQLWVRGQMAATDRVNLGLQFFYALAADEDGSEIQLSAMPEKFGGFEPMENGIPSNFTDAMDPTGNNTPFDPEKQQAGVVGADFYAVFGLNDAVTLSGSLGYYTPQDDDITDWESSTVIQLGIQWAFAPKCTLGAAGYWNSLEIDSDDFDVDNPMGLVSILQVNF